jgi:hypothetical protein
MIKTFKLTIFLLIFLVGCSSSGIKVTPINSGMAKVSLPEGAHIEFNTLGLKSCGGSIRKKGNTRSLTRQIFVGFSRPKIRPVIIDFNESVTLVAADALLDDQPVTALVFTITTADCLLDQIYWVMGKNSQIFTSEVIKSLTGHLLQTDIWKLQRDKADI